MLDLPERCGVKSRLHPTREASRCLVGVGLKADGVVCGEVGHVTVLRVAFWAAMGEELMPRRGKWSLC